ncbi:MAG: transcription-repair coupling factor, partial [Desulfovibrio sp.]|nr:transcription-repair coupling factor [Desulfovibrio sp.]
LEQEVSRLKGEPEPPAETEINLALPAHIPASYIEDGRERLRYYKALTSAQDGPGREEVALAMRDRFGQFPEEMRTFLAVLDFKQFLGELEVEKADIMPQAIKLVWRKDQKAIAPENIAAVAGEHPQIRLIPPAALSLPLDKSISAAEALKEARAILSGLVKQPAAPQA